MITKIAGFVFFVLLLLPVTSLAQNTRDSGSSVDIPDLADIPNDSIVVLSTVETDLPGYVREKYAYVNQNCVGGFQIVDHYGRPIDPRDPNLLRDELAQCEYSRYRSEEDRGD
jgi:hypothetical protein